MTEAAARIATQAPGGAIVHRSSVHPSTPCLSQTIIAKKAHAIDGMGSTRGERPAGASAARAVRPETGGLAAVDRTPTRRARGRDDHGFTVIESLTAAVILLFVAVGVITVLITTANWYRMSTIRTQAAAIADETLAQIRSRPADEITQTVEAGTWPQDILASREITQTSLAVTFSVNTSIGPVFNNTVTDAPMRLVSVSVSWPGSGRPEKAIAYVSGWRGVGAKDPLFYVTCKVQCLKDTAGGNSVVSASEDARLTQAGIRVQLRPIDDFLSPGYVAYTDGNGLATFESVPEAEYWLTSDTDDTRFHAKYFPRRIYPVHGGTAHNPIPVENLYNLAVVDTGATQVRWATLRVGAFEGSGYNGDAEPASPPVRIYAKAVLNPAAPGWSGYFGTGASPDVPQDQRPRYPVPANPDQLTWSAETNGYGIALIKIPWTLESGQTWDIWLVMPDGTKHTLWDGATSAPQGGAAFEAAIENYRPSLDFLGRILEFQSLKEWR
jgi:hypothetical protein